MEKLILNKIAYIHRTYRDWGEYFQIITLQHFISIALSFLLGVFRLVLFFFI